MAYLTAAQFVAQYDERRIRQILSDSGYPVGGGLDTDTVLEQLLNEASEMIAAAVLVGKRYSLAQLAELAAATAYGFLLRRLTGDLAFGLLVARRGTGAADLTRLAPAFGEAMRQLEMLRLGHHIFPGLSGDQHPDANLPAAVDLSSPNNVNRVDKLTDYANRMFPFSCRRQRSNNEGCC